MQQRFLISVTLLTSMGISNSIFAQSSTATTTPSSATVALEEIVITAQRREQTLQETPLAVSVVSGDEIAKTGLSNFNDVLEKVPSIQMQYNPQPTNGPTISIRGIGTDGPNKQSGTALYEDGISSYRLDNYFYDIARVEVLRGPQGTLYGGTATGGAVNIISNNPTSERYEGSAAVEFGNYNLHHAQGMVNLPASDSLSFRFAGNWLTHDQYSGSSDPQAKDALNFRGKALWKPNDAFSLLVGAEYFRDDGLNRDAELYDANGNLTGTRIVQSGHNHIDVKKYFLNVDVDLGFGRLTYIPALQKATLDQLYSTPATPPVSTNSMPDGKVMTHELRLSSEPDSTITWVGGAYYYDEKSITTVTIDLGPAGDINIIDDVHNQQTAGFGQATIPLSDTWRLTGGARYSTDSIKHPQTSLYPPALPVPSGTIPFDKTYHRFDYLARVEHDLTKQNLLYGSISTGYRPGNVSVAGAAYTNETVTAYEVGSKNTLLNGSLTLNAAAFYYKYSGFQQANTEYCDPPGSGTTNCLTFAIVSIPADFFGVELDSTWRLTQNDTITLQPAYLDGHFTANTTARRYIYDAYSPVITKGEPVPHAAKFRFNGNYQHDIQLANGSSLFARGEVAYSSSQFTEFSACNYSLSTDVACGLGADNSANHKQDAYTLVNLSTGYSARGDRWAVTAYVRNLTDKTYKLNYNPPAVFVGAPRTYGVTISAKW